MFALGSVYVVSVSFGCQWQLNEGKLDLTYEIEKHIGYNWYSNNGRVIHISVIFWVWIGWIWSENRNYDDDAIEVDVMSHIIIFNKAKMSWPGSTFWRCHTSSLLETLYTNVWNGIE